MFLNTIFIGLCFCALIFQIGYHTNLNMTSKEIASWLKTNHSSNHRSDGLKLKSNNARYKFLKPGKENKYWFTEEEIIKRTSDCTYYFAKYLPAFSMDNRIHEFEKRIVNSKVTKFAFSHMLHHQVAIYETFLAMYFRPYNFYCIHLDLKANDVIRKALESLINCYKNRLTTGRIFMVNKKDSIKVGM